jgi:hypothetical protein
MVTRDIDQRSSYEVVRWALRQVRDADAARVLWLSRASLGVSWRLTETVDPPRDLSRPEMVTLITRESAWAVLGASAGLLSSIHESLRLRDLVAAALERAP